MKLAIYDATGKEKENLELEDNIKNFSVNDQAIHDVVVMNLANKRQSVACTKTKGEVKYSGVKLWRQKGTGRARAGTIRSPLWVGGGIVFGPQPRSYAFKLNKKVKKNALKSALTLKVQNQELVLMEDFDLEEGKTRLAAQILNDLGFPKGTKVLIMVDGGNENLKIATRNIPGVKVLDLSGMNVYDLLWHNKIIILKDSLPKLKEVLAS